ncbi:ATP-binding protein [Facklamia sp. 7083-14-GEN3]|uniref:ATP-binding protein n=1 Tax=Facklamia sp. 7083-14-GEN3 TaxID=2973478 RepID=UPI00215D527C|nr:ATP-binding protein [Facklamia sp. 7083-14-GEN3]MCR8969785.1 ATP-binding protein [Facklamia sp. 7083-14-GEN3]
MRIDEFYSDIDKNNFYLGMVSQVYKDGCVIQIENLSWLKQRRIKEELLVPNTINYYVLIDSVQGLFIGEVYQSKILGSQSTHDALKNDIYDKIFPELSIDIIGLLLNEENEFISPGFNTVGLTDKVYLVNNLIKGKFLESVELKRIDKSYLQDKIDSFAHVSNFGNESTAFYPETLFDRHLMAIGTTNSGKSTTALSILDKLILAGKKVLVIDPTGEYSSSFPEKDVKALNLGVDTILNPGKVSFTQWATLFETNDGTQPAVLADAITSLRYQKSKNQENKFVKEGQSILEVKRKLDSLSATDLEFNLSLLPVQISEEAVEADRSMKNYVKGSFQFNNKQWLVQKVEYKLRNAKLLDFFGEANGKDDLLQELDEFMKDETKSLYINASEIGVGDGIGSMIIDLISNYIINEKDKNDIAFVMFIDEVHRYSKGIQSGGYQTGLTSIAREGRKKGIFLFLTTQNPNDVPVELLGQVGSLLIHRLTHKNELESVRNFLTDSSFRQLSKLSQGEAIFTSINLLRDLHLEVDKCSRKHFNTTTKL